MIHLDLFSGIGGFALAAKWAFGDAHRIAAFVEKEEYCQKVLRKHWPDATIISDIRECSGKPFRGCDLITGGFPCQPFSIAGKRLGAKDDRHLWPEMLRVIDEARPRWVIGENVAGFIQMALDDVLLDLESTGYEAWAVVLPAASVGAPHRRDRVWIVAHAEIGQDDGRERGIMAQATEGGEGRYAASFSSCENVADSNGSNEHGRSGHVQMGRLSLSRQVAADGNARRIEWEPEPAIRRVAHGIPYRVDRLRGLGNAIVPQVAYEIMRNMAIIDAQGEAT